MHFRHILVKIQPKNLKLVHFCSVRLHLIWGGGPPGPTRCYAVFR